MEISISMYIPWSWVIITPVSMVTMLPLMFHLVGFSGWTLFALTILNYCIIGVMFLIKFRITGENSKRKFDLSPKAVWQRSPRRRWNKNFAEMLERHFETGVKQL